MYADEMILPVIKVVLAPSDVEVEYVDWVYFLNLVVVLAQWYVLGYGFRYAIEYLFEII